MPLPLPHQIRDGWIREPGTTSMPTTTYYTPTLTYSFIRLYEMVLQKILKERYNKQKTTHSISKSNNSHADLLTHSLIT
jgi:hypothetical protein